MRKFSTEWKFLIDILMKSLTLFYFYRFAEQNILHHILETVIRIKVRKDEKLN